MEQAALHPIRIAFITGSLEPDASGVGDQTRLLAQELLRQGHECCLVGLEDAHVREPHYSQSVGQPAVRQLRLPPSMPWPQRTTRAKEFLDEFTPDWLSFQFVCYAFDRKGIVWRLPAQLRQLTNGRQVHFMMHELWIGDQSDAPWKQRVVGAVQRHFILGMLRSLRPDLVHTSNREYLQRLRRRGVKASLMPIFGNVPVLHERADHWLFPLLRDRGIDIDADSRNSFWFFGFFGSIRSGWPAEPLFGYLRRAALAQGRRLVILSAGRIGNSGEWQKLESQYAPEIRFIALGEQSGEKVSQYFNSLDAGFAISQLSLIGKSSVVASMLDHGLPVIVNRVDIVPENESPLVIAVDENMPESLKSRLKRRRAQDSLPAIAQKFVNELQARRR